MPEWITSSMFEALFHDLCYLHLVTKREHGSQFLTKVMRRQEDLIKLYKVRVLVQRHLLVVQNLGERHTHAT